MDTLLSADELVALNLAFETADPREILAWTLEGSGLERVAIASAFQAEGTVVMHLATQIRSDIPILFLETGYQFAETLAFKERLADRLGLNVVDLVGEYTVERQAQELGPRLYEREPERCCDLNKVQPMFHALRGLDAWITAFRRDSSPTRASSPFVEQYELEPGRWITKVNPMAAWSKQQVWGYLREHDLPHNPLYDLGYASIGCAPCTRMQFAGEPERAGRWAGLSKWECGIHQREAAER
jgi:phosphoadenosine phosphosulfate reductase